MTGRLPVDHILGIIGWSALAPSLSIVPAIARATADAQQLPIARTPQEQANAASYVRQLTKVWCIDVGVPEDGHARRLRYDLLE